MSKMRIWLVILAVVTFAIIATGAFHGVGESKAEVKDASESLIMVKLGEIMEKQDMILQKLDEMGQELHVIKIRASR